jgi:type I restriction enzyme S subunit
VRTSNVRQGKLILKDVKYTDLDGFTEWTRRGKPQPGDILFTREAPPGEACIVPHDLDLCLGQRMVLFRVKHELLNGDFGVYSLYAGLANEFIKSLSQGSTVSHFNMSDIGNIPILTPPVEEQQLVVNQLKEIILRISLLAEKTISSIEKLQEYRRSLITAAVTGKLEISEVQADV